MRSLFFTNFLFSLVNQQRFESRQKQFFELYTLIYLLSYKIQIILTYRTEHNWRHTHSLRHHQPNVASRPVHTFARRKDTATACIIWF